MFVRFMDMHSGGGSKEPWEYIYVEAGSEEEAALIFYNRFGHSPYRVTCTCCGRDYSISEEPTLEQATEFEREGTGLDVFLKRPDVLVIRSTDIKDEERRGEVPKQGYVWMG